jgi:hypothetical protein
MMATENKTKASVDELSREYVLEQIKLFGVEVSSIKRTDVEKAVAKVSKALEEIKVAHLALKK